MITGEIKNKIDSLWDAFAAGGIVNPLEVVEQITYLMFIKDLDDIDIQREDLDPEEIDYLLSNLYDYCDSMRIWVAW